MMKTGIALSLVLLAVLPGLASAGLNAPGTTPAAMNQLPLYGPPDPAQWVNVATLLPASGASLQHDPFTDSFTYGFGTQYLVLVPGFSVIRFESRTVTLSQPVIYYDSALFIAKADTPLFRQFVVVKPLPPAKPEVVRTRPIPRDQLVVIDAGHGGHDTGAIANGIYEKNVNLRMARYLKPALEARGFRVKLTRSSDTFIELEERTEIANRCSADFFVAVHANSERSGDITGVETFYYSDRSGRALVSTKGAATSSAKGSSVGKSALSVRSLSYGTPGGSSQCRQLAS